MIELKKKVNEIINELNKNWTDAIKEGQEEGIDLSDMFAKYSTHVQKLDAAFADATIRKEQKKRW